MDRILVAEKMDYEEFLEEWKNGKSYIIALTSGSTGQPKEIRLNKDFVERSAERTNRFFSIGCNSRLHSCVSPDFIGGKMMAVRAEIGKCRLTWENPSNEPLKDQDRGEKIDLLSVVPSQMIYILEHLESLPDLGAVIIGGGKIPNELRERIAASGINAYESYGMTETASHIALRKVENQEIPFHTIEGISVECDERKCLKIKFDSGEVFITNDLAEAYSGQEFIIKGRIDNIINSGGKKVSPEEIENKISSLISSPFMIKGETDSKWGERIVLVIEGEKNDFDIEVLHKEIQRLLPRWQVPKQIKIIDKLPRTKNGKLIRFNDVS